MFLCFKAPHDYAHMCICCEANAYICMYVCMYIHTYMYMYYNMYYMYMYVCMHIYVHVCTYMYVLVCMCGRCGAGSVFCGIDGVERETRNDSFAQL